MIKPSKTKFSSSELRIEDTKCTKALQEESLIEYMAGIGYEALYNDKDQLIAFRQPRFDSSGCGKLSVNTAIKLHNREAYEVFDFIQRSGVNFDKFLKFEGKAASHMLAALFAGSNRIVKNVKGQWSKKKGLIIQSNVIEFNTRAHYNAYKHLLEEV